MALIDRISRVVMVTHDLDVASMLFETFDAKLLAKRILPATYADLVGLPGSRITEAMLRLGDQDVSLIALDPSGRAYPSGSTSTDLWFQHIAIVVSDIDAASARLTAVGRFQAISTAGVEHLPPSSGSVSAFKFRDTEGHPLELLFFPDGEGPAYWQTKRREGLFLGLDHSALAVGDSARSTSFFERAFGLKLGTRTENSGPEQSRLDDVPGARVTVSGLMPGQAPPHLELLAYHVGERRPIPETTQANDVAATFLVMETHDLAAVVEALTDSEARFVSPGIVALEPGVSAIMVLDPDGHRFCVVERA